ncbi:DNA repair protein rad2 [Xylographa carneopallida]|nr:DNA repair protein rad2 [Xylographa carneopallida]
MGVTGLWTVLQPCARPIKLETLNKKRLAVDASIWIYQFLKAVRDKEGNALRNSHVVGFFRRICKLLFFGIKPVFVFDGGAPALKRQTISGRKARREGRREDAVRTAGKLLAVQMQRRAEEEDRRRREESDRPSRVDEDDEEEVPENMVYVDELQMTAQERQRNRTFRKKDAYHLPELDVSLAEMGAPNDPRIMSQQELEDYARQFHTGEDINLYDFSKIDFNSPFFVSLPASDRYNILNAARLRSRLRMGYSKEQLDNMFPDRMAFSKFQVERVTERNELTQRLMNLAGMNGADAAFGVNGIGRVAGEKGREYVLVKNDGVEGGWALGVVSNKQEGERNKPIDVEGLGKNVELEDDEDEWEDDGFEDVPIEGLNRLPKRIPTRDLGNNNEVNASSEAIERRKALYRARREAADPARLTMEEIIDEDPDSLFLPQSVVAKRAPDDEDDNDLFEDVLPQNFDEESDLQKAIAMSLEDPEQDGSLDSELRSHSVAMLNGPRLDKPLEFNQRNAKAGRAFAHVANARARDTAPRPFEEASDVEDNMDLQAALAESRRMKHQPQNDPYVSGLRRKNEQGLPTTDTPERASTATVPSLGKAVPKISGFNGPLPFESLSLGKSMLTKKKKKPLEEEGGFEKDAEQESTSQPIPPWFSGDIRQDYNAQRQKEIEDAKYDGTNIQTRATFQDPKSIFKRQETGEVIDLEVPKNTSNEPIEVESSESEEDDDDVVMGATLPVDSEVRMGDIADLARAEPPESELPKQSIPSPVTPDDAQVAAMEPFVAYHSEEGAIEWEESDLDEDRARHDREVSAPKPAGGQFQPEVPRSPSPEFENVGMPGSPTQPQSSITMPVDNVALVHSPNYDEAAEPVPEDVDMEDDGDIYSDPEDEELMRQLAVEAEEHARFAATLSSSSHVQSAEDYERELRQLRNQQKKDRRDADEVSHLMVTECQQLLKLFGLPYITAPMEAEAQCAELVHLGLVDGIVTDDSDIFLFGGTRVYKNMFNQAKFVECYLSTDLEKEYSLDRNKVIQLAHLLGSDYTEGIPSVGPVTALEILSEFESLDSFRDWWTEIQMGHTHPEDTSSPFRRKFKRNAAKLFLPPIFPDKRVDHAYLHPDVDSDPSAFAWGVPDLDALRGYLMATIGWNQERADEILVPVIRDMNRRENEGTQANITQFFGGGVGVGAREKGNSNAFAPRRRGEGKSKRMESALGRLHARAKERTHGEDDADGLDEAEQEEDTTVATGAEVDALAAETTAGKEGARAKWPRPRKRAAPVADAGTESGSGDDEYQAPRKSTKRTKGAKKNRKSMVES